MANSPQAKKRARQSQRRQLYNTRRRSSVRTAVKKVLRVFQTANYPTALSAFRQAVRLLDKTAGGGVIHPNKAARLKSRLSQKLKTLIKK